MESVCPLCNGIETVKEICPNCGGTLVDGGRLANYLGAYSPYVEIDSLPFRSESQCIHLIFCPKCSYDVRTSMALMMI